MSITLFSGIMGSGKSYEAVVYGILPAIAKGRRVVANIDGLNEDLCREFVADRDGLALSEVGRIKVVPLFRPGEEGFYPAHKDDVSSDVRAGDLVVVDEAYRFYGDKDAIKKSDHVFFREHRHYVAESGEACDLLIMTQDVTDLARQFKVVIEMQVRFKKLRTLGLSSRYSANVYEGHRVRSKPIRTMVRQYEKKYFPLYHSYAGGKGKELVVDKRGSVFSSPWLWLKLAGGLVAVGFAVWHIWQHGIFPRPNKTPLGGASSAGSASPGQSGPPGSVSARAGSAEQWRVIGYVERPVGVVVFVVGADGQVRQVSADSCKLSFYPILEVQSCQIDSTVAVPFFGPGLSAASGLSLPSPQ